MNKNVAPHPLRTAASLSTWAAVSALCALCTLPRVAQAQTTAGPVATAAEAAPAVAAPEAPGFWQEVRVSVAAKLWVNEWTSWVDQQYVDENNQKFTDFVAISGHRTAIIPAISARWRNWLVAASSFTAARYSLSGSDLTARSARHESDVSLGYYVLPTVALSAGYKTVHQAFNQQYHFAGPTLGISGSAPLPDTKLSVYGSFAQGVVKATFGGADAAGHTVFRAVYNLNEFGFAYSFGRMSLMPAYLTGTVGYRQQSIITRGYRGYSTTRGTFEDKLRDATQGLTMGVVMSY
jgi:hypothetical protein